MLGPGAAAPELTGTDIVLGGTWTLSAHAGEVVVVCFGAYWCPHCQAEVPRLQNLWTKYRGHGVQIVFVHEEGTLAQAQAFLSGAGVTFSALHDTDGSLWSPYATGDTGIPQNFFVGRDQHIHSTLYGGYPEDVIEGRILDALYAREPVDIEMVMDVSDSMNSPSVGDSKLAMMKQAITMVTDFLVDHGQPADRMGLVWFTDNATEFVTGGQKLLPVAANSALLEAQIDAHTTGTCTAMGAGLQMAFDALCPSTQKRAAILCTDGMQNIEPKVEPAGGHLEILDSGGWLCGPHSSTPAHPGVDVTSYDTTVHTIGVGIAATYAPLLQQIADATGGFYRATNDPAADLDLIYFVDLCNCLAGGSPAIVRHAVGTLSAGQDAAVETFALNRSARKISALLSWPRSQAGSLTFWLSSPDGTVLDLWREMEQFDDHCLATVYLPRQEDDRALQGVGEWRMVIRGETAGTTAPYHALVVAEDRENHFSIDYPRKLYEVGDVLTLAARLRGEGPLPRIHDVVVERVSARVPIPELLARYRLPHVAPAPHSFGRPKYQKDPLALKLESLSNDPKFSELLRPVHETLSLRQGGLTCSIGEREITMPLPLERSGLNTFRVVLTADSPGDGPLMRTDLVSVHVAPGKPDPKQTHVGVVTMTTQGAPAVLLTVTPRNSRGEHLGPGFAGDFKARAAGRDLAIEVEDGLDGTYQLTLSRPEGEGRERVAVTLNLLARVLWKGEI